TASFDFFLTRPYLSLRIDGAADVETTIVLLVIGLLVGEIVVRGRRNRAAAERAADEVHRMARVAGLAAEPAETGGLVHAVEAELVAVLGLQACDFLAEPALPQVPRLE